MPDRKEGYYWVRRLTESNFEIGYWFDNVWIFIASSEVRYDKDFSEIDEHPIVRIPEQSLAEQLKPLQDKVRELYNRWTDVIRDADKQRLREVDKEEIRKKLSALGIVTLKIEDGEKMTLNEAVDYIYDHPEFDYSTIF
jgi:hypothetical protein